METIYRFTALLNLEPKGILFPFEPENPKAIIGFMKTRLILGILSLTALIGCRPDKNFSDTPNIEFSNFDLYQEDRNGTFADIVELEIYFTDGDGDIGLNPEDTTSPNFCNSCPYYNNLLTEIYTVENGVKSFYSDYNARIKDLTPTGQNKTLEGSIFYQVDVTNRLSDSLQFTVQLLDRKLHKSNVVESPVIHVNF